MIVAQEYIKKRIGSEALVTEMISTISYLGIDKNTELNQSLEERLDTIWDEFKISEKFDIKNVFFLFKEYGLNLKTHTDEKFIDKIEGTKKTIQYLGYENVQEVTKEELEKIKVVVEACELELDKITESESLKMKKISNIGGLNELEELSLEEVGELGEFFLTSCTFTLDSPKHGVSIFF